MNLKQKIWTSLFVFGVITLLFVFLIIYPLFNDIKRNSEDLVSQKKELVLLENKIENLKKFEKIYQIHQQNLEKIDVLFVNPEVPTDIIKFVEFLRKAAKDSQVSIEISPPTPKTEITADPWPSITFQISSEGQFSNFSKFLEKIEAAPYLIEVSNLNINKTEEVVEIIFSIKVFVR